MTAVDPEGRIRHPLDVFHSTYQPDGSFVPAGYVPVADGAGLVDYLDSAGFGDTTALDAAVFGYLAHGNTGASETFDASVAGWHSATLNAATVTATFSGATTGEAWSLLLELTQDGTGGRLVTWPGSVVWPGGVAPTLSTAAGATDILTFFTRDGGTTWYGFPTAGGSASVADLDDLGDVTITGAAADDTLRYDGSDWINDNRRWEPVTFDPGTGPEIVFTATDIVMTWETY